KHHHLPPLWYQRANMASSPPDTIKAQFLDAFNTPYNLRSVPLPKLTSPYDLLVRVDAASYCHTDAVLASGQMAPFPPSFPHISCHEFAGTVVSLPSHESCSDTKVPKYPIGTRLGIPGRAYHPCTTCAECLSSPSPSSLSSLDYDPPGYSVYCPHALNLGISAPGGFAQYALADSRQVAPLPDEISAVDGAALMCAGLTIYAALKKCGLREGQRVGIMGCGGGLGHLGVIFAVKMGLRVVGVENSEGGLEVARGVVKKLNKGKEEKGEVRIVDARVEGWEVVKDSLGREDGKTEKGEMGVHAVVTLPESQAAFEYGMGLLRNRGKCVVVSFPEKGFNFSARDVVFRDVQIVGSLVGSNRMLREMLAFAAEHKIRPRVRTFPLGKLNELVEEYHKGGGGKLVVDMHLEE
ncbi:chaperonin 10-like protein, partial [Immersiella caudata]